MDRKQTAIVVGLSVGGFWIIYELSKYIRAKINAHRYPFVPIGTVSQLYIYPLKSGRGQSMKSMDCAKIGAYFDEIKDRHFMIIDQETKRFVTARQISRIVLIETELRQNQLTLRIMNENEIEPITIDIADVIKENRIIRAEMFNNLQTDGYDCGVDVGRWLQKSLNTDQHLSLIYFVSGIYSERDVIPRQEWQFNAVPKRKDAVAYPDLAPYMAVSQASVDNLNAKFNSDRQQFSARNFRPNIVVDGCPEFDEDKWNELKIGNVQFVCYKPCTRCVLTTVDPEKGVRDSDNQPLKKLREYRLAPGKLRQIYKDSPVFGTNMGVNTTGRIHLGDVVYARYKPTPF